MDSAGDYADLLLGLGDELNDFDDVDDFGDSLSIGGIGDEADRKAMNDDCEWYP